MWDSRSEPAVEQSFRRGGWGGSNARRSAAMMPDTVDRVPAHTDEEINRRIALETARRFSHFAAHPEEIDARLSELDAEWDVERMLQAKASALAFTGLVLGMTASRKWLVLPGLVTMFLFQHAIQGWCPPVPVLRRLGFRTQTEIEQERYGLKALRGDFEGLREAADRLASVIAAIELRIDGRAG